MYGPKDTAGYRDIFGMPPEGSLHSDLNLDKKRESWDQLTPEQQAAFRDAVAGIENIKGRDVSQAVYDAYLKDIGYGNPKNELEWFKPAAAQ